MGPEMNEPKPGTAIRLNDFDQFTLMLLEEATAEGNVTARAGSQFLEACGALSAKGLVGLRSENASRFRVTLTEAGRQRLKKIPVATRRQFAEAKAASAEQERAYREVCARAVRDQR